MTRWTTRALALQRDPHFREGLRDMAGVALGIGAWGMVTGVAMVKSGMGVGPALLMSVLVFSGTAQLATAPLIAAGAPLWVVWATALCLNLRFVVFSVMWRPYFVHLPLRRRALLIYFCADLNYVLFMRRYPKPHPEPGQVAYAWGGVVINAGAWHVMSLLGIALAQQVPDAWGLGFAGTVALLGMTVMMLADRATWLPAGVAGGVALATHALPLRLNLLAAISAAVAAGLLLDRFGSHRAKGEQR